MKKLQFALILLILLLLSGWLKAQVFFKTGTTSAQKQGAQADTSLYYVNFPDTPTFGTTTTINPTDTNIQTADLGGNSDIILGEGFHVPNILVNGVSNVRFKGVQPDFASLILEDNISATGITRVGDNTATGTHSMRMQGSTFNNVKFYDLWFYGGTGTKGELSSRSFEFNKIKITDGSFAGILAKTDNDSTVARYNVKANFTYMKRFEGEAIYIGQVNGTNYHEIDTVLLNHIYADSIGREGLQTNHVRYIHANKGTWLKLGFDTPSGSAQRNNAQIMDTFGVIENQVFVHNFNDTTSGSFYAIYMMAHGVTFRNCVFISPDPIYIGNIESRDWWPRSWSKKVYDSLGGQKILFDNCSFRIARTTESDKLAIVFGDIMDIEFRDCTYSNNMTGLFSDGRSDKITYDLIDGGGNTPVAPTSIPFPEVDSLGRMLTRYYWDRGIGWLTPN
jgi:hypothetical protein